MRCAPADLVKKSSGHALEQFVAEASKRGVRVHEAWTEFGTPAPTIVDRAREGAYDLIVIGTHGRTGLSRVLIGSVAERVVRHASCLCCRCDPRLHLERTLDAGQQSAMLKPLG